MSEEKTGKDSDKLQDLISLRSKVLTDMENNRKLLSEIEASISKASPAPSVGTSKKRAISTSAEHLTASTGIPRLDDLLMGGYPDASNIMLSGPPYSQKDAVADRFIASSLTSGYPVIVVSIDRDVRSLRSSISDLGVPIESYEQNELLKFVDAYSRNIMMDSNSDRALTVDSAANTSLFLKTMDNLCTSYVSKFGKYRMVFFSLTGWITQIPDQKNFPKALQHFSQRRKLEGATSLYLIEDGIFERNLYENMNYFMDGSIEFRSEISAEYIRVRGMNRIKSRDWIELVNEGGRVTLGSFELKRIK